MRSALECAPKTCKCGRKLPRPEYGYPYVTRYAHYYIKCKCHTIYSWSFPPDHLMDHTNGVWMITSDLPLFNTKEVIVIS
jgi:hypothetical protein